MAIKFNSVKCPECGASLPIEENRKQLFCSYCGTSIIVTNENEYIYHHIDEAEVKQAETDRIVRLKELELEEREDARGRKGHTVAFVIALIFVVVGALMCVAGAYIGAGGILIGAYIALFTYISADDNKKKRLDAKYARSGLVKITDFVADYEKKDYRAIESAFRASGFTNIKTVNLKDLTTGLLKKPGLVEEVTINGDEVESDKWYSPNALVVITYHDFSR